MDVFIIFNQFKYSSPAFFFLPINNDLYFLSLKNKKTICIFIIVKIYLIAKLSANMYILFLKKKKNLSRKNLRSYSFMTRINNCKNVCGKRCIPKINHISFSKKINI